MNIKGKRVLVFGGSGLLGKSLCPKILEKDALLNAPSHDQLDVKDLNSVRNHIKNIKPDLIINCFVSFGGIKKNEERPCSIMYDNLQGNLNIINSAIENKVEKYIQISSQCIYGDKAPVPFLEEEADKHGLPTSNNAPYGISKRVLHLLLDSARKEFGFNSVVLIPSNMYGKNDNFHPEHSHVIPVLIRRFIEAKEAKREQVVVWGSGNATREFLYADDAADAIILAAEKYDSSEPVNIGTGREVSIKYLARTIADLTEYEGEICYNNNGLDGQDRRVSSVNKAKERFGFEAKTSLEEGLLKTIKYFKDNRNNLREKIYYE